MDEGELFAAAFLVLILWGMGIKEHKRHKHKEKWHRQYREARQHSIHSELATFEAMLTQLVEVEAANYEQRKTNKILGAGCQNLAWALDGLWWPADPLVIQGLKSPSI